MSIPETMLHHLADYAKTLGDEGQEQIRASVPSDALDQYDEILRVTQRFEEVKRMDRIKRIADGLDEKADGLRLHEERKAGPPSWAQIDHDAAFLAARDPKEPEVGRFTQTATDPPHGVFYTRTINEVHGASESGKSWLVLYVIAQELMTGHGVVMVDYEDSEGPVYRRLALLGVTEQQIRRNFRYHRPNGPMTEAEKAVFAQSTDLGGSLVVFDGLTEGMSLEGLDGRLEKDVAAWHGKITKGLSHAGWCVVVIDHTPHEGNRTIGSQHKKGALSGVSYLVEAVHPIGAGQRGVLRLRVEKDRPASVRREAAPGKHPQWRGDLVVDFSSRVQPDVALFAAASKEGAQDEGFESTPPRDLCKRILAFVEANPGCGTSSIRSGVSGAHGRKDWAVEWLITHGHLIKGDAKPGQKVTHHIGIPFDQEEPRPPVEP